jgi:hypothetical protein
MLLGNCTKGKVSCSCDNCHKTCLQRRYSANCKLTTCEAGCCCPEGTYWSEVLDQCVETCPCIFQNETYKVGEIWLDQCRQCECTDDRGAVCKETGCHITRLVFLELSFVQLQKASPIDVYYLQLSHGISSSK